MKELICKVNNFELYALDDKTPHELYEFCGKEISSDKLEFKLMMFLVCRLKELENITDDIEKQTAIAYALGQLQLAQKFISKGIEKNE